ncbi:MAG: lytic transglycosylase domain-containing protein [Helicobacter trogontum]|uniref:lytic transglycosylase domain-containing protein n=1 Tax=Helicobacter trogontum TaxID=50960 RepID=UPI00242EBD2B|nr:lytic transglycosylase domain-containing protein [Helicobacter trogontum]MCI5786354.1 lytic transglycosylase domain-containing protein [Helicobacter trogontum]
MRYFSLFFFTLSISYADSIIDFGKQETKAYKVYQASYVADNNTRVNNEVNNEITQATTQTKTQIIAHSNTPTHKGSHLKGQEFFNYYIKGKPKGIVRDFYIWQYLDENKLNATQINEAYQLLSAKNPYLRRTLKSLGKTEKMPRDIACQNMQIQAALKEDNACLAISTRAHLAAFKTLGQKERDAVISRLSKTYPDTTRAIKILATPQRTSSLFGDNAIVFSMVYHALSAEEKNAIKSKNPNHDLNRLSAYKSQGFYSILNSIALDSNITNPKKMLLESDIAEAPHNTLFLLGINELRFGSKDKAMTYFKRAKQKSNIAFFVDRAVFWQYLVSKDKRYLEALLQSKHVNIFSIYAAQKLGKQPKYAIITKLPTLAFDNPPFDLKDPYVWQNITNTMLHTNDPMKLAKVIPYFSYKDTMPQLAYLMQKIDNYTTNYYITPYEGLVEWNSKEEQSLVFSIARQESHFIPTLISRSFALGIMQIMPANVQPFAKEMGRTDIGYNDLFDPKTSLEMGRHFIKQLQKEYKHPLFVAYAYNGGPGFLRRTLKKNELFLKNREYEPWLSMELIPLEETRYYGMRVLANFIIYEKIFGKELNLEKLLSETLLYENVGVTR